MQIRKYCKKEYTLESAKKDAVECGYNIQYVHECAESILLGVKLQSSNDNTEVYRNMKLQADLTQIIDKPFAEQLVLFVIEHDMNGHGEPAGKIAIKLQEMIIFTIKSYYSHQMTNTEVTK